MILVFNHIEIFQQITPSIIKALIDLGIDVKPTSVIDVNSDDLYIIVALQTIFQPLPRRFIVYNFEQLEISSFLGPDYYARMKKAIAVWDYSLVNIEFLKSKNIEATHVPFGYTDELICENINTSEGETKRDIDVFFVGGMSPRRRPVLDDINNKFKDSFTSKNCFGDKYSKVVNRSKIGINIHYYEKRPWIFEICRVLPMLANGCTVISERSDDKWYDSQFEGKIIFTELDELCNQIQTCLSDSTNFTIKSDAQEWLKTNFDYSKLILKSGVTGLLLNN
ncbi:hypothetical protein OAG24_01130 [bacterium]|nr:hypothetical protein [bacterium]